MMPRSSQDRAFQHLTHKPHGFDEMDPFCVHAMFEDRRLQQHAIAAAAASECNQKKFLSNILNPKKAGIPKVIRFQQEDAPDKEAEKKHFERSPFVGMIIEVQQEQQVDGRRTPPRGNLSLDPNNRNRYSRKSQPSMSQTPPRTRQQSLFDNAISSEQYRLGRQHSGESSHPLSRRPGDRSLVRDVRDEINITGGPLSSASIATKKKSSVNERKTFTTRQEDLQWKSSGNWTHEVKTRSKRPNLPPERRSKTVLEVANHITSRRSELRQKSSRDSTHGVAHSADRPASGSIRPCKRQETDTSIHPEMQRRNLGDGKRPPHEIITSVLVRPSHVPLEAIDHLASSRQKFCQSHSMGTGQERINLGYDKSKSIVVSTVGPHCARSLGLNTSERSAQRSIGSKMSATNLSSSAPVHLSLKSEGHRGLFQRQEHNQVEHLSRFIEQSSTSNRSPLTLSISPKSYSQPGMVKLGPLSKTKTFFGSKAA